MSHTDQPFAKPLRCVALPPGYNSRRRSRRRGSGVGQGLAGPKLEGDSMRVVAFAAAALLFSAADSALAMSFFSGNGGCAKGMLWPYVRNPGDCLTDAEIQAGQRGVYS